MEVPKNKRVKTGEEEEKDMNSGEKHNLSLKERAKMYRDRKKVYLKNLEEENSKLKEKVVQLEGRVAQLLADNITLRKSMKDRDVSFDNTSITSKSSAFK